jgi:16S rRNA (cytosine1402-N4)-methyltransferase
MHYSVLLEESIKHLNLKENSVIVDCTLGYAGHSSRVLKEIKKGFLFAFDQDDEAIKYSKEKLDKIASNYEIIRSNFVNLKEELNKRNINEVDGILYDLGVSSPQLDNKERGFSFHADARLDMRMDTKQKLSAYEVVNNYSYDDLVRIFRVYGEEKFATSIAKNIITTRENKSIETTLELAEIIKNSVPEKYRREKHPARKVFQAIRIEVNNELNVFENSLNQALDLVKVGGRICVITFHSLEDRICKDIFKRVSSVDPSLKNLPIIPEEYQPKFKLVANIEPSAHELEENNRSRSARLRVIERVR